MKENFTALNLEDMAIVNGGTFTANKFPEWAYRRAGFTTNYHFLAKDEFILNGVTYNEDQANAIMAQKGWSIGMVESDRIQYTLQGNMIVPNDNCVVYNGVIQHE